MCMAMSISSRHICTQVYFPSFQLIISFRITLTLTDIDTCIDLLSEKVFFSCDIIERNVKIEKKISVMHQRHLPSAETERRLTAGLSPDPLPSA